jgi:plastocyanin domain-containing protein
MKRWMLTSLMAGLVVVLAGCSTQQTSEQAATPQPNDEPTLTAEQAVATSDTGTDVTVYVTKDGFVPASVHVPAGKPVTLHVTRKTEVTCATELVIREYDIKQALPLDKSVAITFTPMHAGDVRYACGMDMIAGTIVVE